MNLVVEIGNTNIKFALFTGRKLNQLWLGKEDDILWEKLREFQIQNAILSGSGHTDVAWWTCITFTLITSENVLIGGSISPGLALRAKSMHDYTDKLPLMDLTESLSAELIGLDTHASLVSGVLLGTLFEVEKRIEEYLTKYPNLNIIMTGGSTQFFVNKLNYKIFADDHFTLKGLNELVLANE